MQCHTEREHDAAAELWPYAGCDCQDIEQHAAECLPIPYALIDPDPPQVSALAA